MSRNRYLTPAPAFLQTICFYNLSVGPKTMPLLALLPSDIRVALQDQESSLYAWHEYECSVLPKLEYIAYDIGK
jgi:hypothetical protein